MERWRIAIEHGRTSRDWMIGATLRALTLVVFSLVAAGCDAVPASLVVTLGNGRTVEAPAKSGQMSQPNSTWAFYANSPLAPLSILGGIVAHPPGFIFRSELGEHGEITRVTDNEVISPDTLGQIILINGQLNAAISPGFFYSAESYGAEEGDSIGVTTFGLLFVGPFEVARARIEFSGTTNALLARSDGKLRFVTENNPLLVSLGLAVHQTETTEIDAFALREQPPVVPLP